MCRSWENRRQSLMTEPEASGPGRHGILILVRLPGHPHRGGQARQRIAGLLWPESTDAQALTKPAPRTGLPPGSASDSSSLVVTHQGCLLA